MRTGFARIPWPAPALLACALIGNLDSAAARADPATLARMWAVPGRDDVDQVDWMKLPALPARHLTIVNGIPGESGHMHHPSIVHFDGRFLAAWNDGYNLEDRPGQRVRFATSADGVRWSEPQELTGRHPQRRYTTCGLWIRDGKLVALVALRDARRQADR